MKRTILVMLIAASMLLSIGVASSMTCYINDVQDDLDYLYDGKLNATLNTDNTSDPGTIVVTLTDDTKLLYPNSTITTILLNVPESDIVNVTDNFGNEWTVTAAAGNPFGTFLTKTTTNEANLKSTDPITIYVTINGWDGTLPANADGNVISIHIQRIDEYVVGDEEGSAWVTVGYCEEDDGNGGTQEIPEFPTIALPIAAIIGLAFIFQSRKE
ncbi:PEF-CTERM sorting domain-containing protein [Methanolobus sediminis]|uniref:PEF-CTERM sorting domain-containing protein n=1 Tax=Methanolobus sediminis TaxID=3072978 RepID=A0AA51UIE0_9EURY|nr:PEF-CTERM sorting domain-containing protein [Methanolobus sediminis]WMW24096.1 PEF-CTERM sorting domain-containing protein [Methanolobus sediminis]